MSEVSQKKCSYYNSCYFKFSRQPNGCRRYHPEINCQDKNYENQSCHIRFLKIVNFEKYVDFRADACIIIQLKILTIKSMEITEEKQQIVTLQEEIVKVKSNNNAKTKDLFEIHSRELDIINAENIELKKEIRESRVSLVVTLVSKDEEIVKALKERYFEKAHTLKCIDITKDVVKKKRL